jgi:hypothetical protein
VPGHKADSSPLLALEQRKQHHIADGRSTSEHHDQAADADATCGLKLVSPVLEGEGGVSDGEDHRGQCYRVFQKIDACGLIKFYTTRAKKLAA